MGLAFYHYFSDKTVSSQLSARLMAMCTVMSLLPITLFLCFQKSMIGGVKVGGVKG